MSVMATVVDARARGLLGDADLRALYGRAWLSPATGRPYAFAGRVLADFPQLTASQQYALASFALRLASSYVQRHILSRVEAAPLARPLPSTLFATHEPNPRPSWPTYDEWIPNRTALRSAFEDTLERATLAVATWEFAYDEYDFFRHRPIAEAVALPLPDLRVGDQVLHARTPAIVRLDGKLRGAPVVYGNVFAVRPVAVAGRITAGLVWIDTEAMLELVAGDTLDDWSILVAEQNARYRVGRGLAAVARHLFGRQQLDPQQLADARLNVVSWLQNLAREREQDFGDTIDEEVVAEPVFWDRAY